MPKRFTSSAGAHAILSSNTETSLTVALDLRLAAYRGGGISRYARELFAALAGVAGITATPLWSQRDHKVGHAGLRLRTPPHHRLESIAIPIELALGHARFDVYHAPDFIAPRLRRTPVVATVHDLAFVHWPDDLESSARAYYRSLRHSRARTAAWITPSRWTATQLAFLYDVDPDQIHVIPHGDSLGLGDLPVLSRSDRDDYILAVGTIEPRKRYHLLLDAVSRQPDGPRLIVVGQSGWQAADLEHRLRQVPTAVWLQDVDDARLRELYRAAIAVVIPSRAEGFGLPALEAMAAGTPVLSSGGGALLEVTADAAEHVPGDSWEAWADAIARITADTARWEHLSAAGRRRAESFSWERAAQDTAAVYRTVTGR
jgi:glycosyltransferase involved in cell wall biosynthesis